MVVLEMLLVTPGFLWLMWAGILVGMFKFVGLGIMFIVQGLLVVFLSYWNQKNGLSRFVEVVVGAILLVTNIMLVSTVVGMGGYVVALLLGPIVFIYY